MIIGLEGAPSAGKTTIARYLVEHRAADRIAQVNETFLRPDPESVVWYFQRQIDRCARAARADRLDRLVVLDGDPLRPVWFRWVYPKRAELPWWEVLTFFADRQAALRLPRFYAYLPVTPEQRYRREVERAKARGQERSRMLARYHRYEAMLGPQEAYFAALGSAIPEFVLRCESQAPAAMARAILAFVPPAPVMSSAVLAFMRDWLGSHSPGEFASPAA